MKNQLKNKVVLLIGLSTACLGMTEDQQHATWEKLSSVGKLQPREQWWFKQIALQPWRKLSNAGELLPPHQQWWHEATVQPHKKELETARQMYRDMGITPPLLRTSFLGQDADSIAKLRSGYELASADEMGVHLGPRMLHWLGSNDPWLQSFAKQTLAHEHTHLENQDRQGYRDRINMGLPAEMWERWNFNSKRRDEINADKRGYEKLPIEDLMRIRDIDAQLAEQQQEPHSPLHPSYREKVLMIDEELERRETGKRLSEAESLAAQSFFARNYHPNETTGVELYSIVDELKWLDQPENKSKKQQRVRNLGGGLFELEGQRHGFWVYYGVRKDGNVLVLPRPQIETKQESEKRAREIFLDHWEEQQEDTRPS